MLGLLCGWCHRSCSAYLRRHATLRPRVREQNSSWAQARRRPVQVGSNTRAREVWGRSGQ
jgi:hypothetical protein